MVALDLDLRLGRLWMSVNKFPRKDITDKPIAILVWGRLSKFPEKKILVQDHRTQSNIYKKINPYAGVCKSKMVRCTVHF